MAAPAAQHSLGGRPVPWMSNAFLERFFSNAFLERLSRTPFSNVCAERL
jgi:hypothetical protein